MALVYLSVSSNVNRQYHIKAALSILTDLFSTFEISSVYRNQPLKGTGDDYFNLALKLSVDIDKQALVAKLKEIENSLGRVRGELASAVSIDIDLLCFENETESFVCDDICQRSYLLKPLSDIAGDKVDPCSGLNYQQLWAEFDQRLHPLLQVDLVL